MFEGWRTLLTDERVHAVLIERGGAENYCSLQAAQATDFWGHNPRQQKGAFEDEESKATEWKERCLARVSKGGNSEAAQAKQYTEKVARCFKDARAALSSAGRKWTDVPFSEYVAHDGSAQHEILGSLALDSWVPYALRKDCWMPWCKAMEWWDDRSASWGSERPPSLGVGGAGGGASASAARHGGERSDRESLG